jgi:hypothetical protein
MMVAAASLLVIRNPMAAEELTSYLGKYKKAHVLLDDVNVSNLNYVRRDRAEYAVLRRILTAPYAQVSSNRFPITLTHYQRLIPTICCVSLKAKYRPGGKFTTRSPDDSGTNALDNLILIKTRHIIQRYQRHRR